MNESTETSYKKRGLLIELAALGVIAVAVTWATIRFLSAGGKQPAPVAPRTVMKVADLIEAETLKVVAKAPDVGTTVQNGTLLPGIPWSSDAHLFVINSKQGGWVELEVVAPKAGKYQLDAIFTKASDYGIVEASVEGKMLATGIDLFSTRIELTPTVPLGVVEFKPGRLAMPLRLTAVSTNPKAVATKYQFGVDGVFLRPR